MTPRLNKNRPDLGQIHPPHFGAMYEQDGHFFAGDGTYLFSASDAPEGSSAAGDPTPRPRPEIAELPGGAAADDPNRIRVPLLTKPLTAQERLAAARRELEEAEAAAAEAEEDDTDLAAVTAQPLDVKKPAKPSEVDLQAWVDGRAKYPFFKIKKRVAEYGDKVVTTNATTIKESLLRLGVVTG